MQFICTEKKAKNLKGIGLGIVEFVNHCSKHTSFEGLFCRSQDVPCSSLGATE